MEELIAQKAKFYQSDVMLIILSFLAPQMQLETQRLCSVFYK